MSHSILFTPSADSDFDDILHFIAADNPARAISFIQDFRQRLTEVLSMFPDAGKRIRNYRMMSLDGYVIVYRVDNISKSVYVLIVSEGHRDWQELLSERS